MRGCPPSTLYPLQLPITSPVSDWTLEQKGMICLGTRKRKVGISDSDSVLLCQAADICMDIHSKLPENRL